MRRSRVAVAAWALPIAALAAGLSAAAPAAAMTGSVAAKLSCSATVSSSKPAHGKTVDVRVRTSSGAFVATIAHYKSGSFKKTTHANSGGKAVLAYKVGSAAYGYKVAVAVYVDKAKAKGRCSTSFTPTAPPKTYRVGSCRASGDFATCDEAGDATDPADIQVHVTASTNQSVLVSWDDVCSEGDSAASTSGQFTATTPVDRKISHPFAHPDSCTIAAGAQLQDGGGSLHVWTVYER